MHTKRLQRLFQTNKAGLLLAALLILPFLAGCAGAPKAADSADGKLLAYTSFYPMYDFAKKVGGDKAQVVNMTPDGTEPHDWEPTATDVAGLEKARVFIYNGAGLEHWVNDVLASLQNTELIAVETSQGVALLQGHSHEEDGPGEAEEPAYDPHVWLDPMNAKAQMEAIKNAFAQADPANAAYYEANYETYAAALDELDAQFREALLPLTKKELIVSHEAFGYLCAAYGLEQVGIEGLTPDSEPDPAHMAEIIDFAKARDVKVVFYEALSSPKVAEAVARAIGGQTAALSPLEGLSDEQRAAGDDYFDVMRQNLAAIKAALQ